jgi:hypothetical protein
MIFAENLDKIQISGYCDYWNFRYYMFEPQVWYKVANRLCAGLEFRISNYSLLEEYSNYAMIGIKWNLE